ncbi:MAG: alpha/beta hydrolase [Variibacter sp.]|nr:alpha/beta hydrolase [Variibacter sp.]
MPKSAASLIDDPAALVARTSEEAAALVARLAASGRRAETPCGDGNMVWRIFGEGPPVVLLHGGHGAWTHWVRNLGPLSRRFQVLAADMPGFGESASPPAPYTADSLAEIVAQGLDRLLPGARYAVTGFSFGGVVGGVLAKHRPAAVRRLVLVGSGGLALPRPQITLLKNWKRMESEAERLEAHRTNLGILMLRDQRHVDALALHLQATNTVRTRINSRSISLTDVLRRSLPQFPAPLAGIWGIDDATSGPYLDTREKLLRELDPSAEFIRLDGGHWIQYEAPDAFNAALTRILEAGRTARG